MILGLTTALAATVCFGFASVLQARGARAVPRESALRAGLPARLARNGPFVLGTALDVAGFGLSIVALRTLPLFLVQALTNASLAVTAAAAVRYLGVRLRPRDLAGITAVVGGLILLAAASGATGRDRAGPPFHFALLLTTLLMLLLTALLARWEGDGVAVGLGLLAGVGFGVTSLAVRVLDASGPLTVFTDPAAYALALGGLGGYLAYALALQRGSVTAATAASGLSETVGPGAVGVLALGDHARPGLGWLAAAGFALAVGGVSALARFGEVGPDDPSAAPVAPAADRSPGPSDRPADSTRRPGP
ncbi:hypothetical protein ACIRBX_34785 [Kitasatospora sp. NPDC096147]|uniref:hypothetical protein n=1 Tax=Kitasatospora sp. NPDC096147 TaxID=3364093 RepID=UPI0038067ABF